MCKIFTVMRILKQPSPVRIAIDAKQLENVEYYNCVNSMITVMHDVHVELNPGLSGFNKKKALSPASRT